MSYSVTRRKTNTLNTVSPPTSNISAVLYSNSGLVPLVKRNYILRLGNGEPLEGTTNEEGYLQHLDIPPGDYDLEIDKVKWVVPTVADPDERLPIRVRAYYLVEAPETEGIVEELEEEEEEYIQLYPKDSEDDDVEEEEGEQDEWEDLEGTDE